MAQYSAGVPQQQVYAMPGAEPEPRMTQEPPAPKDFAISTFEIGDIGWCLYR